jgi:hypothetical protein
MTLIPDTVLAALRANAAATAARPHHDPVPVVKLFNPVGAATWLATELLDDGTLFGLADLGFGCPELGYFSLVEIGALRLPFGLRIERDSDFSSTVPLSLWADLARREGSIIAAEAVLRNRARPANDPLPPG